MSPYFITIINGKTAVVTVHEAHDGGMVEFRDAVSGEVRGSAGIHWWQEDAHKVQYNGPLPSEDDHDRWIYQMRRNCYGEIEWPRPLRFVWCKLRGYHRPARDDSDTFWCRDCNCYMGGV